MEVALSSIPSVTRDCIPKVLFQRGESRQDAQGTEVLDKCGDSLCHHGESDLGPAPCGKPARFAKDFIQQRLWVRQILASRHRRQTQVHPPGRVANCLPNSHLIEKKPCLLHPNYLHLLRLGQQKSRYRASPPGWEDFPNRLARRRKNERKSRPKVSFLQRPKRSKTPVWLRPCCSSSS